MLFHSFFLLPKVGRSIKLSDSGKYLYNIVQTFMTDVNRIVNAQYDTTTM